MVLFQFFIVLVQGHGSYSTLLYKKIKKVFVGFFDFFSFYGFFDFHTTTT